MVGNRNNASDGRLGAGVYGSGYSALYNTIVFGNLSDGQPDELQNIDEADLATCCTNDPSFVNAAAGDYRLKPTSICRNAGKNSYAVGAFDLAGKARIQEWTVDLGAYEYCPIMAITAAPEQATAGTAYSYTLTQTGGAEPVTWTIDDATATKNVAGEIADSSTFAVLGEKLLVGGQTRFIDLPFAFPYGGTTYTRACIYDYGAVTLGNDSWFPSYTGYNNKITDESILSIPVILPYLAYNWGTSGEDGCGIFVDQSVPQQMTIRWATYYGSNRYRANFSMTLYANGEIRFSYGEIEKGYDNPSAVGLSFGDSEHCLDMLSSFGGSNANDILFHPLAIPEGISVSGNRLVGTPAKGGTYCFRVSATEAGGEAQSKIVTMDVLSNYTIHFDGNGAKTGTAPANVALTSVEEYVLPEPDMTCGCARFLGWATNATGAAVYQPGDKIKCLTAETGATVTLYAAWENIFVLQFDGNASGVIGAHVAYTNEIGKSFYIYRDEGLQTNIVEFGERYMPCRVGWFLDNWNMCADGSGEKFLRNATSSQWSQSVSSESFGAHRGDVITLYAQWFEDEWDFDWADPQLGGGKWVIRLNGDEGAKLWSASETVVWPESLTLPASYRGRTVSSLGASLRNMKGDPAYAIGQIIVPEGYTNLTDQAFMNLYHLESITFPSTLEVIPKYCCEGCTNLTSVGFAEGNRVVGNEAFAWCTALPAIELPRGLTNLEASAFYSCTNLTAVVLSPDYVGGTSGSYQFYNCPIAKLEIPASCQGFGYQSLNLMKALRFLGDLPSWNVYNANHQFETLIEYPATNTTWNAGPIANYSTKPHKGFVGPVAAFGVTDAYFWTNANETVTFAYAESPLAATVTLPEGAISWGGVDWEVVGFEPNAFAGQPTATVYYPILEYAKWEQVTPPEGITLAPVPGTFFTLTFHVNGGNPYVPATMTFPPNGTRALPSAAPTKSAYKFLGWATTAGGAAAYQPGDNYTAGAVGGSATLFAKWEEVGNYTIRFAGNSANATGVPDDIVTAVGTMPAIPDDPEREGWTFSGWTNAVNATVYQAGDTFDEGCAKDTTFMLYAKWTSATVNNLDFVDENDSTWTYKRTGDSITITAVTPGASVTSLTVPTAFKGGTVANPTFDPMLVYSDGAWLKYSISSGEATITGFVGTLPADLVIPSSVTAGGQSYPVTKIGDYVFDATSTSYENTLKSVVIPDSVKVIGCAAFRYCEGLETVSLGQGVERILGNAFAYDDNLAEIEFPSSLTNIGQYAFYDARDNYAYSTDGGRYADTGHTYLIEINPELEGEVVVADTVKITGDGACMKLKATSVVFPSGLEIFGRNDTFRYNSHTVAVTLPGSARLGEGSYTGYTTYIKTVTVMGAPPSWNLESYFTGLTTIKYPAIYAAEWAEYRAAHPELEYVEEMTEVPVGDYVKFDLEQDLGIVIGDYDKNEKVSVKGLPSGLKLVATKQTKKDKKKTVTNVVYTVEGVPTAACDFTQQPVYAVVTSGGKTTWQPLALSVAPQAVTDLDPLALGESVTTNACEWLPGVTNGWSVSGLPDGLKYTSKNVYAYKNAKKKTGKYLKYPAYTVYGNTTKAGRYTITAKKKKGSYYETLKYRVMVEPKAVDTALFGTGLVDVTVTAYEAYSNAVTSVKIDKVTGLPAGLAFAAKDVYGYKNAKKKTGKYLKQSAQTIVGTPTKPGTYVVTYTKNVKSGSKSVAKTAQVVWTVEKNPNVPTADFNRFGTEIASRNAGSNYGTDGAAMTFGVTPGASVSASGLPKGLSLKKVSDGTWAIVGTPSKTGTSYVTVTVKLNGNTVKQSLAIQVRAHPLAGKYSGYVTLSGRYLGTAKLTVSSVGKVSLSLVEKGVKTSATLSKVTAVEESPDDPAAGKWKCAFTLKAYKKGGREVLPKRTLTLVFERNSGEWELPTCSSGYRTSAGELFAYVYPCRELSKAEIAARVAAGRIPELPSVETLAIPAGISGSSQGEAVAAGEVVTVSAVYKASTATYTVTGRLPDGKTFSASAPVLWCGFDEPSHDAIGLDYILVANGAGDKYELLIALPYYGDFSPEARVKFCYYKQLWGNGQYWEADEFRGLFGDGDPWTKLPGTVSAALGVEPGVALPISLLWRAAELPGEPVAEGPYLFKVTEKTVTEKKKKVTKHYASVSADDGATWTTSKNPISWTAGRAAFNVTLNGFAYAFDLALDHSGELTGWAKKSHTKYDTKKKKNVTVVDAVGSASIVRDM